MSRCFYLHIVSIAALGAMTVLSGGAQAQGGVERLVKGAPAQLTPLPVPSAPRPEGPLTVADVVIDKTAENAVVARQEAIADARRQALQKLAARNMTPEALRNFKLPDDKTIAMLVQDFEIRNEQLSRTRYVAHFTVRFRDAVTHYLGMPVWQMQVPQIAVAPAVPVQNAGDPPAAAADAVVPEALAGTDARRDPAFENNIRLPSTMAQPAAPVTLKNAVLVLPYFETIAGKTVLWEEPNPWRAYWQKYPPKTAKNSAALIVPLGDIADVSAGPSDTVWSGNYATAEKLRRQYAADHVVLATANRSGARMTVDVYLYDGARLHQRRTLTLYPGDAASDDGWRQGVQAVMEFLSKSGADVEAPDISAISRDVVTLRPPVTPETQVQGDIRQTLSAGGGRIVLRPPAGDQPVVLTPPDGLAAPAPTPYPAPQAAAAVEATAYFSAPAGWMDIQRRLAALRPAVQMDLRGLSRDNARVVLRHSGSVPALEQALASQGLRLRQQAPAGGMFAQPLYTLEAMN